MAATFSFVRVSPRGHRYRFRFALLLSAVVCFGLYKALHIGLERPRELLLSVLFDSFTWLLLYSLSATIALGEGRTPERLSGLVFYLGMLATCLVVFAHTFFFDAAIERRLTVFDVTAGGVREFFTDALPTRGLLELLGLTLALLGGALGLSRIVGGFSLFWAWTATCVVGLVSGLGARVVRPPSVLFDSATELWEYATLPRVQPRPFPRVKERLAELDKSRPPSPPASPMFSKLLVLVMETMTLEQLVRESAALPETSFWKRERRHFHRYLRYFATNQDSRTGMLAMLTSQVVPFEAYTDASVRAYAHLADGPSLLDPLRRLGFKSAFVVAQRELEAVVSDLPWDARLHLSAQDVAKQASRLLCFASEAYENGCEDLALLPKVSAFLRDHERAFVYQELNWGHSHAYNEASGKSNAEYYGEYVDALLASLLADGLLDDTLLVLTSDHGFRGKSEQAKLASLQIPLIFYAPRFTERSDGRLLSHVDFRAILLEELGQTWGMVTPNQLVMVIGPTGSGMVSAIDERGGLTLLRNRFGATFALSASQGSQHAFAPGELLYLFERYRTAFTGR